MFLGKGGEPVMDMAKEQMNPHHFIVGAQGSLPVDAAGNPWSGSYVHCNGNLVLDLLDNLVLESTGRLQKCRIYQMSENKTLRATVSFLIARDEAHEMAFAKALETLGVDWGKALPIPKFDSCKYPEVKKLIDAGINREQYHFRLDSSLMEQLYTGSAPANDGTELRTLKEPIESYPIPEAPERPEEFSPGLDPELAELADAFNDLKTKIHKKSNGKSDSENKVRAKALTFSLVLAMSALHVWRPRCCTILSDIVFHLVATILGFLKQDDG